MNWKIAAVVVIAALGLIGIGGTAYFTWKVVTNYQTRIAMRQTMQRCTNFHDPDKAIAACTEVIQTSKSRPQITSAYLYRSYSHQSKHDYDAAIADAGVVIARNPKNYMAHTERGSLYILTLKPDLARADLTEAITIDSANPIGWAARGSLRAITGDTTHALSDCKEAIGLQPRSSEGFSCLGITHLRLKQYPEAVDDFNKALLHREPVGRWLYYRGLAKRGAGDLQGSRDDIAAAAKADPTAAATAKSLGFQ